MLTNLDPAAIAAALEAVADIQLRIDRQGVVTEVSVTNAELSDLRHAPWQGQAWLDIVSPEHRDKAADAVAKARRQPGTPTRVDVGHPWQGLEGGIPISYRLVCAEPEGPVFAIGVDLRAISSLRQQLVNAQQAMEQDYWATRQIENRYRRLFEMASDGFLVVDDSSGRILEANRRATELLSGQLDSIVGRAFPMGFADPSTSTVTDILARARVTGSADCEISLSHEGQAAHLTVTFIRQGNDARFLIKLSADRDPGLVAQTACDRMIESAPDAILVLDDRGSVISANNTFLEWTQTASTEQVIGRAAETWLGRSAVDMTVLLNNLRQQRFVRLYASVLRCSAGTTTDIEISAVRLPGNDVQYGLFLRDVARRVTAEHPMTQQLPRSIEQITRRVGRVPLKELVRESTDVIEALCIEAALALTKDNRASAAELLGLSRQSLYTKLRRYGIGESDGSE